MAVSEAIARRYAQALFELAREADRVAPLRTDLAGAVETLEDERVSALLGDPRVTPDERARLVGSLLERSDPVVRNLVRLLVERGRASALPGVLRQYDVLADRASGVVRAEVVTAVALEPALEQRIVRELSQRLGGRVQTTIRRDPSILGGLVVRVGDRVVDASVRTRLEQLQSALA